MSDDSSISTSVVVVVGATVAFICTSAGVATCDDSSIGTSIVVGMRCFVSARSSSSLSSSSSENPSSSSNELYCCCCRGVALTTPRRISTTLGN